MATTSKSDEETLIFSLSYCSRAIPSLRAGDIEGIVVAARLRNARQDITGWLVYGSGIFFQWLEGSRDEVKSLMESIKADARHNTVVILSESEDVRERLFAEWDMELVSAGDIRNVLVEAISESSNAKNIAALQTLLKQVDAKGAKPGLINNLIDF